MTKQGLLEESVTGEPVAPLRRGRVEPRNSAYCELLQTPTLSLRITPSQERLGFRLDTVPLSGL